MNKELYPLYHCQECGCFFKKVNGRFVQEGLKGQQSEVIRFTCPNCKEIHEQQRRRAA